MTPFLTVPFKFSPEALNWIMDFIKPIVEDYQRNAPLNAALLTLSDDQINLIKASPAWPEIITVGKQYNLGKPWPQLFVYKKLGQPRRTNLGNPHIDTYGPGGTSQTVCVRFNILLKGEDTTEMVWWDHTQDSELVITSQFVRPDLSIANRLQIKGKDLNEQWALLGEPNYRATHLGKVQEYASFVRTDIIHALNWTGNQPRVVFSLRFPGTWDEFTRSNQS